MKYLFTAITFFFAVLITGCDGCNNQKKQSPLSTFEDKASLYDVVIVGAGIAGLKTALDLKDMKTVVLEKENRAGGRINRRKSGDFIYDMGAIWGFLPMMNVAGTRLSPHLVSKTASVGFYVNDSYFLDENLQTAMQPLLNEKQKDALNSFITGNSSIKTLFDILDNTQEHIIRSYFHRMHMSDMEMYLPERQRDAFTEFPTKRFDNNHIIDALVEKVPDLRLNAEVTSIKKEKSKDIVRVNYTKNNISNTVYARSVVVATPANVARNIISNMNNAAYKFLHSVNYSKNAVLVVFVVENQPSLPVFSILATPSKPFEIIYQTERNNGKHLEYQIFYSSDILRTTDTSKIFDSTQKHLESMGLIKKNSNHIKVRDLFLWETFGTVINEDIGKTWSRTALEPLPGVFLAGDYTVWEDERTPENKWSFMPKKMPYGIIQAWRSGAMAAHYARKFIQEKSQGNINNKNHRICTRKLDKTLRSNYNMKQ